jgi:hypothetical protein
MKIGNDAKGIALLVGVGALAFVGLWWFLRKQATDAASAVAKVNDGTPYANTGVVGTVGHGFDAASGGTLSDIGSWIGGKLADLTMDNGDPNKAEPVDLVTRKQAVSDGFWSGIQDFFTPGSN